MNNLIVVVKTKNNAPNYCATLPTKKLRFQSETGWEYGVSLKDENKIALAIILFF